MGYGLAPSQQSADTETGATPSFGGIFFKFIFLLVFVFCIFREVKNKLVVRLRVGRWHTLLGDVNVTDDY